MNDFLRAPRVLVVEDDEDIAQALQRSLRMEGYDVRCVADGQIALEQGRAFAPDLVILDLGLPHLDGIDVARALREDNDVPILILTARDAIESRVEGLDAGADDYLVKPFSFRELAARIRALSRRELPGRDPILRIADLEIDTISREVRRAGRSIALTSKEYAVLELLAYHRNQVLTRVQIAEHVWSLDFSGESNVVDVYIRYLRRKMDEGFTSALIYTIRGVGYQLKEPA
jgi:two-component system, OmpR family, response regulator MprA